MTARRGNLLGFLVCVCLLGYAYYAQYVMHLEPCPLCIFQRIGIFIALPLRSLDRLSLQNKLRDIGHMEGSTAKATEAS